MDNIGASHSSSKTTTLAPMSTGASHIQQQAMLHSGSSSGSQLRSRITVVCAECKRLKLKCDRRTPCQSCTKRDCIEKCIYSAAASEKIDVQTLHNRLCTVEGQLTQITSGRLSLPHSISSSLSLPSYNDRALLAVGNSGSSVVISLEDVAGIWLEELEIGVEGLLAHPVDATESSQYHLGRPPAHQQADVKLEPTPPALPFLPPCSSTSTSSLLLSLPSYQSYFNQSITTPSSPIARVDALPSVTTSLFALLPTHPLVRETLLDKCEHMLKLHPSFNWPHFKSRVRAMFQLSATINLDTGIDRSLARDVLFGSRSPSQGLGENNQASSSNKAKPSKATVTKPTLSFFAAAAAALALGALIWKEEGWDGMDDIARPNALSPGSRAGIFVNMDDGEVSTNVKDGKRRKAKTKTPNANSSSIKSPGTDSGDPPNVSQPDPTALFALSQQALSVFETCHPYDLDYLVAMILQALFLLHDGVPRIASSVFPMVGKMVNVARMMGLAMDPDEFPAKYSVFEAETRRRIWWDVYYYDLFISDCMGHPPAIADNSHTTKLPAADVDEERFQPGSTEIPLVAEEVDQSSSSNSSTYFVLKCRLAQLIKRVKKRTFYDPLTDQSSPTIAIEQAAEFEAEVQEWLRNIPRAFCMDMNGDSSDKFVTSPALSSTSTAASSESPYLVAQRSELAIVANRLILKVYLPFLRSQTGGRSISWHQASQGTVNAAHAIVISSRALHTVWGQNKRPAAFAFYSFSRTLFDASVCLAHAVIQQPNALWSRVAMTDAKEALEVMKDPKVATGRGPVGGGVEGSVNEAVTVVEKLLKKADMTLRPGSASSPAQAGMKRKHEQVGDSHTLSPGFHLPYVGPGVQVSGAAPDFESAYVAPARQPHPSSSASTRRASNASSTVGSRPLAMSPPAIIPEVGVKKSGKTSKVPHIGVRVRSAKEGPPFNKQRQDGESKSPSSAGGGMYSPAIRHTSPYQSPANDASAYSVQEPVFGDTIDNKDFPMSFAGAGERLDSSGRLRGNSHNHDHDYGRSDYNTIGSPPTTARMYNQTQGNVYNTMTSASPLYGGDGSSHGQASNESSPFSGAVPTVNGYPPASPFSSSTSLVGAREPHSIPYGPVSSASGSSYAAVGPQNSYPTNVSYHSSDSYPAEGVSVAYNHSGLHSHHMHIMNNGMDSRHLSMESPSGLDMSQSHNGRSDIRGASLPVEHVMNSLPPQSYIGHPSGKPVNSGVATYVDGHGTSHLGHHSQSMSTSSSHGWPSDGVSCTNEYWTQNYGLKTYPS